MKKNISLIIISICLVVTGCICKEVLRPDRTTIVKIKAKLSNNNFVLKQNDTLFIEASFPDSVVINRLNLNDTIVKVNTLSNSFTDFDYDIIDTTSTIPKASRIDEFIYINGLTKGPGIVYFNTNAKPYKIKLGILLKAKGYYYLGVSSQLGEFNINNNIQGSLAVDFDVPDKHIEKIRKFVGNAFADNAINRGIIDGLGRYAFKVE